jgi:GNAT superfamily N-acetyltransferase
MLQGSEETLGALADGYHVVPPGKLVSVVTSLEMCERPALRAEVSPSWSLRHEANPDAGWYKELYAKLGGDWLWFSRLTMPERELRSIIQNRDVQIHVLKAFDRDEGILELDFREPKSCEISFFAVAATLRGQGAGRWLMNRAIELAWTRQIDRLWVHTCSYDHPGALAFYERSGFRPYLRRVEVADDPRLSGHLPREAAPHVAIL